MGLFEVLDEERKGKKGITITQLKVFLSNPIYLAWLSQPRSLNDYWVR